MGRYMSIIVGITRIMTWLVILCLALAGTVVTAQNEAAYKNIIDSLTRQLMMQELYMEEKLRSEGDSGVKQIRVNKLGTQPYYSQSHSLHRMLAIHEHSNHQRTVGLGEFIAVLNGYQFRTRHNDYKIRMPSKTSKEWGVMEDIPFPDVPPSVLSKPTLKQQIEEMKKYFEAFKLQNTRKRDYRKYFKPILCYLEGMWTVSKGADAAIDEPFDSDRHFIDASSWFDLTEKIRFSGYTGRKNLGENLAYLPTKIIGLINGTIPQFAQWNYRIACAPLKNDVRFGNLMLIDDVASRMSRRVTMEQHKESRAARFQFVGRNRGKPRDMFFGAEGFLDYMMAQIPGRDNYPGELHDFAYGMEAVPQNANIDSGNYTKLNTAYYHRFYKTAGRDAMGTSKAKRGYADKNVFMAMTSNPKVPAVSVNHCTGKGKTKVCKEYKQRWTYAIPLELIYLTPLNGWNPHDLEFKGRSKSKEGIWVTKGGRNGGLDKDKAYNGTNYATWYITPSEFYAKTDSGEKDTADTAKKTVGVLDKKGEVRSVSASGIRIFTPDIEGVGKIRLRWPVAPITSDGDPVYKELAAIKQILMNQKTYGFMMNEKPSFPEPTDDKL